LIKHEAILGLEEWPASQTDEDILKMETFPIPLGKAGWDQLHAMTESVQSELEQMFSQRAKLDSLTYGVGKIASRSSSADDTITDA